MREISTAAVWRLAAAGEMARSLPPRRSAGPFRWARVAVARRSETLSVGRRVPLPANPARPTRKCRSQRVPRTSPKCASIVLTSSVVLLLFVQCSRSPREERRRDKMTASAKIANLMPLVERRTKAGGIPSKAEAEKAWHCLMKLKRGKSFGELHCPGCHGCSPEEILQRRWDANYGDEDPPHAWDDIVIE